MFEITENIYGHKNRLKWIASKINKDEKILEFGCGTGYMVTIQLLQKGYDVLGLDLDKESIDYGKKILDEKKIDREKLQYKDMKDIDYKIDTVIASEVFEHIETKELCSILKLINEKLNEKGKLIVTVPNGYGWYEAESFIWKKLNIGNSKLYEKLVNFYVNVKLKFGLNTIYEGHLSTLSYSPHVQRFTMRSIKKLLKENGFSVVSSRGSGLVAGPLSDTVFNNMLIVHKINNFIGLLLPFLSSGFYLECEKNDK